VSLHVEKAEHFFSVEENRDELLELFFLELAIFVLVCLLKGKESNA
jgi:hypothetical protein